MPEMTENAVKKSKKRSYRGVVRLLWTLNALAIVAVAVFSVLIYNGVIGYMPPVEDLRNPNDKYATRLFTADGEEMGRYYQSKNNRVYADYDEISENVVNALIATEDVRFESHSGIDFRSLARVLVKTVILGQCLGACDEEAGRVGDSREAGALLYERRDIEDVSQPFRLP